MKLLELESGILPFGRHGRKVGLVGLGCLDAQGGGEDELAYCRGEPGQEGIEGLSQGTG